MGAAGGGAVVGVAGGGAVIGVAGGGAVIGVAGGGAVIGVAGGGVMGCGGDGGGGGVGGVGAAGGGGGTCWGDGCCGICCAIAAEAMPNRPNAIAPARDVRIERCMLIGDSFQDAARRAGCSNPGTMRGACGFDTRTIRSACIQQRDDGVIARTASVRRPCFGPRGSPAIRPRRAADRRSPAIPWRSAACPDHRACRRAAVAGSTG